MIRTVRTLAVTTLAALCAAPSVRAEGVRLIGPPGAPSFPGIQEAVDAAGDGDLVLVAGGEYAPFVVADKSLSVVAVPGATVQIAGTVEVRDLAPQRSVVLAGLEAVGAIGYPTGQPGLRLVANLGHVRVQDCSFTGGEGERGGDHCHDPARGGHGAELSASLRVAVTDSHLRGGRGTWESDMGFYECEGGDGGDGLRATGSAVALFDCEVRGGAGGENGTWGGDGGAGCHVSGFGLYAAGTLIHGGAGGDAWDFVVAFPGDGGDGLVLEGSQAQLLDVVLAGGPPGTSWIPPAVPGEPGLPQSGDGVANVLAGSARHFSAAPVASDRARLALHVEGQPGDRVHLVRSTEPAFELALDFSGTWLVSRPDAVAAEPLGVIPATGVLDVEVKVAWLPGGAAVRREFLQGLVVDAGGAPLLAGPLHFAALNRAADPDCDANGVFDPLDVLEGTSADCQQDLVPDACQIAAGSSADCNANGVPDECDVESGASQDLNGNGVPDECEGMATTRYVDAAAPPGGDGSAQNPFQTIGAGLAASLPGDTVLVADGLYTGPQNRDLSFTGRDLELRSLGGPAACVIDCEGAAPALRLQDGETPAARVEGFTIRRGSAVQGGGLYVFGSDPTLEDCVVEDCTAITSGGGLYLFASRATVRGCAFFANHVTNPNNGGGAIAVVGGDPRIDHCTLIGNTSENSGGGLFYAPYEGTGPHVVSHCVILENSASGFGGGVYTSGFASDTFVLDHCLIAGNSASEGGGVSGNGELFLTSSTVVWNQASSRGGGVQVHFGGATFLANDVVWGNTAPTGPALALAGSGSSMIVRYCDVQGGQGQVAVEPGATLTWSAGNIQLGPLFVDLDGPDDDPNTFADNDYRLGAGSPCTDAGDDPRIAPDFFDLDGDGNTGEPVPFDLDGAPRQVDDPNVPDTGNGAAPLVDMGAYERQP